MYGKVIVPLDKSTEAEKVLPLIRSQIGVGGEVVLLHIIPLFRGERIGHST